MNENAETGSDDIERLVEKIAECLAEAERLGLAKVAIDLDLALHKVRPPPSKTRQ